MGRQPCCDKVGLKKGPWTADEDKKLINFILTNGQCCWRSVPKLADLKRGLLSDEEENLVIHLHAQLGNSSDFCIDEIPVIGPHEIMLPPDQSSPTPSCSSSCSSNGASWLNAAGLAAQSFEDYCSEIVNSDIWEQDFKDVFDLLGDFESDLKGEDAMNLDSSSWEMVIGDDQI
ncbi:hypothetical protein SASPL_156703 [Salvia splendens]|uniref:Myb-like domain-containing protein n=1 Tax=Salvia splendens TaxID=180675 RepID=A0A8X8VW81_SALSN|nr:hypothetical protein SASPL_156703 [Salvia splendens]